MRIMNDLKRKELAKRGALIFTMLCGSSLIVGAAMVSWVWMIWVVGIGVLFGLMALVCFVVSLYL